MVQFLANLIRKRPQVMRSFASCLSSRTSYNEGFWLLKEGQGRAYRRGDERHPVPSGQARSPFVLLSTPMLGPGTLIRTAVPHRSRAPLRRSLELRPCCLPRCFSFWNCPRPWRLRHCRWGRGRDLDILEDLHASKKRERVGSEGG